MRMVFSEVVGTLSFLQPQADDDMTDRLHYYYTTTFLLVTSVLISLKMYGGRPIECWMPAEYQSSWQEYTEIYCFSMNTYFTPFTEAIPSDEEIREKNMISYYQWTPFFLVICAFLFYSPCLIWRVLYTKSGIRIKDIIAFANDRTNIQPKMREANIKGMSAHLGSVFRHRFRFGTKHPYHHKFLRLLNLRFYEAYLTFLYIGIKVLFLVNVTIQMFLMNWFLQTSSYRYYGFGVLEDLIYGRAWSDSGNFPRVTYCDMDVRVQGNVQKHTVQCVLVINIFIEKVFVLLWIWYSFLLVATIFSLVNWIFSSFPFEARKKFIARRLELADVEFKPTNFEEELEEFVRDYIKMDGVFMLRMLTIHAGILVCTEVVDSMWEDFIESTGRSMKSVPMSPATAAPPPSAENAQLDTSIISQGGAGRRKTSVLVPLVSAQPNGMNQGGFLFQSLMGNSPHVQSAQPHSKSAVPYAAAAGAGLAAATAQMLSPKGDFLLKKPPSSQQWRLKRIASGDGGNGRQEHQQQQQLDMIGAKKTSMTHSADSDRRRQSISTPNVAGSNRPRRTSHHGGLPLFAGALGILGALRTQRSNSAATQQSAQETTALWEVEEGTSLRRGNANGDEEEEEREDAMEEENEEEQVQSKDESATWHASNKKT